MKPIDELLNELNNLWTECSGEAAAAKSLEHRDLSAAAMWEIAADEIAHAIKRIEMQRPQPR